VYQWPGRRGSSLSVNLSWQAFEWCWQPPYERATDSSDQPISQYTNVGRWQSRETQGLLARRERQPIAATWVRSAGTVTRSDNGDPVKYANVYTDGYNLRANADGYAAWCGRHAYTPMVERRGSARAAADHGNEESETVANFSLSRW
jgi:hypothetical protein